MKTIVLALFSSIILIQPILSRSIPDIPGLDDGKVYRSIPPKAVDHFIDSRDGKKIYFSDLKKDEIDHYLGLGEWNASVEKVETNGNLKYIGSGITGESGHYRINIDYTKYHQEDSISSEQSTLVGVGVRIKIDVNTNTSGLNVSDLHSVSAAFNRKKLSGSIHVNEIGIISSSLVYITPSSSDLSKDSLEEVRKYMEKIKSVMNDQNTRLKPYVLAIKVTPPVLPNPIIKRRKILGLFYWPFSRE